MPRSVIGTVVSNKMMKSVTVAVTRLFQHTRVGKTVRETKKYMAHDELNACGPGDLVRLDESRPLSRHKRWVVTEILRRQRTFEHTPTPAPSSTTAAGQRTPAQ